MARNIVFLGIKHCGKSTQGRLLAGRLQRQLLDTDDMLTAYYMQKYGQASGDSTPRAIMQKHGEEFFRRLEAETIKAFLAQSVQAEKPCVMSLGGGVPCNAFLTGKEVKSLGVLVHLVIDPETAFSRIAAGGIPPFLAGDDPHRKFMLLAGERMQLYNRIADINVQIPPDPVAGEVSDFIYQQLVKNGFVQQ